MLDELIASPGVVERSLLAGRVGVMALHGGLEAGTVELADRVARTGGASLYAVVQPPDLRWHVPSVEFDPRRSDRLIRFLGHVGLAVSFHGFGRRGFEGTVLLGGGNRSFARRLAEALHPLAGVEPIVDLDRMPRGLRGLHPRNPVNLPEHGGVQIELSPQVREPQPLAAIARAVAAAVAAEHRTLCVMGR